MDKIYEATEFSRKFFPKLEIQPLSDIREYTSYALNKDKGGYRYHRIILILIYYKVCDKYGFWNTKRTFLYSEGWITDGFWKNCERDASKDHAVEYDFSKNYGEGSFSRAWDEILSNSNLGNYSANSFKTGERLNYVWNKPDRILKDFSNLMPECKLPYIREFVCATNMLEREGFIEGCAYEGAIPVFGERGYVLVKDDAGVEKLLPSEFFKVEG